MALKTMSVDTMAKETSKGTITTIYGLPDSGKSTFVVSVAEKMKVLFIDAEGKFGKIVDAGNKYSNILKVFPNFMEWKDNITGIRANTLYDLVKIVTDPEMNNYDAIVIDSITSLVDHQSHDIMYRLKKSRTYNDYAELGTQFFEAIEQLKKKGISSFLTIQGKEVDGMFEPDGDGNMVQKHAMRYADWMFFIEEGNGGRTLNIKNQLHCRLKKKNIPENFKDQLVGKDVKFSTLWDVYPSKTAKEDMEKERLEKEEAAKKEADRMAEEAAKKKIEDIKTYGKSLKGCETIAALKNIWTVITTSKLDKEPSLVKIKDEMKIKLTPKENDKK